MQMYAAARPTRAMRKTRPMGIPTSSPSFPEDLECEEDVELAFAKRRVGPRSPAELSVSSLSRTRVTFVVVLPLREEEGKLRNVEPWELGTVVSFKVEISSDSEGPFALRKTSLMVFVESESKRSVSHCTVRNISTY